MKTTKDYQRLSKTEDYRRLLETTEDYQRLPKTSEEYQRLPNTTKEYQRGFCVASALAMGADLAYIGSRFIATKEANAEEEYKQMLVDSAADDIVYSSLFTGVHGNYLKPSVSKAGFDPDNLPEADKTAMNFGSGGNTDAKAWKDIWGCGQGIGNIESVETIGDVVDSLEAEYKEAVAELHNKERLLG